MREEYKTLVSNYVKFTITRLTILIVIFFSFNGAIEKYKKSDINSIVAEICNFSYILKDTAKSKNWLINTMYLDDCRRNSGGLRVISLDKRSGISTKINADTSDIYLENLKERRRAKIEELEKALDEAFLTELPILKTVKIDLMKWLFYLPFLILISEIYLLSVSRKIKATAILENSTEPSSILKFPLYYPSFKKTMRTYKIVELIIYLLILDSISKYILGLNHQYIFKLIFIYSLISYLVLIHHRSLLGKYNKWLILGFDSRFGVGRLILKSYRYIYNSFKRIKAASFIKASSLLILSTLFLGMSRCAPSKDDGIAKGYKFFLGKSKWNIDGLYKVRLTFEFQYAEKYMTFLYVLIIIITIICLAYLILIKNKNLKIIKLFSVFYIISITTISIYFLWTRIPFSGYYDWPFLTIVFSIVLISKQYYSKKSNFAIQRINIWITNFLYLLPFLWISTISFSQHWVELSGLAPYWFGLILSFCFIELMAFKIKIK